MWHTALTLIGLFNVFGTYLAGSLGAAAEKYLLSVINARSLAIVVFCVAVTPGVYLSRRDGLPVLSTVPLQRHRLRDLGFRYLHARRSSSSATRAAAMALLGCRLYD